MLALSRPIGARLLPRAARLARLATDAAPSPSPSSSDPATLRPPSVNPRWLDAIEADLVALRKETRISTKDQARVGKKIKKLRDGRLALLSGAHGFLPWAPDQGVKDLAVAIAWVCHVNNLHYNRWAETGRVNWLRAFADSSKPEFEAAWRELLTPKSLGVILASITTEYKVPVSYPDTVSVIHRLASEVDDSSTRFYLHGLVFSSSLQRVAAQTWEEIVLYDYAAAAKAPLRPFMVDALQRTWDLQEQRRLAVEAEEADFRALIAEMTGKAKPPVRGKGGRREKEGHE
ncbi:hypothetical protein ESCO_002095 [Escovopsis weberi]|uniref:Uncharacterized protein n=1 Tax=Escovopsis weberi TaxID=150374 RepID=A0A0M8N2S8_ESCWE|nr:hypothetical protein ESCO_002095 [Escovopsis weberi]